MARQSLTQLLRNVRQEAKKVTWPTRKETTITTIFVLIMVVIMAIFFSIVDGILYTVIDFVLSLGR